MVIKIYNFPEILRDASGTQYPTSIWQDEKKLVEFSIYPVVDANKGPNFAELYISTTEVYEWDSKNKNVKKTYSSTARAIEDEEIKDSDGNNVKDADGNNAINMGIKNLLKSKVKKMQGSLLSSTDKWIIRKADTDEAIPSTVVTYRKSIRDSATNMETAVDKIKSLDDALALLTDVLNSDGTVKTPATLYNFPSVPVGMPT